VAIYKYKGVVLVDSDDIVTTVNLTVHITKVKKPRKEYSRACLTDLLGKYFGNPNMGMATSKKPTVPIR